MIGRTGWTTLGLTAALLLAGPTLADEPAPDAGAKAAKDSSAKGPRARKGGGLRLTLRQVALLALRNNAEIRRLGFEPEVSDGELQRALAEFDPTLFGSLRYLRERPSPGADGTSGGGGGLLSIFGGGSSPSDSDLTAYELGLRKKTRIGGTVELVWRSQRQRDRSPDTGGSILSFFSVMEPEWTATMELRYTQPLLRGFGVEVNTAAIRIAEIGRDIARLDAADAVRRAIAEALLTYWDLALAMRESEINEASLARAKQLLGLNQERLARGLVSKLDVLRAEVGVAQRQESIITIRARILDVEDRLKKAILPQDEVFRRGLTILPTEATSYKAQTIDVAGHVARAFARRPDYRRSRRLFDSRQIAYRRARNAILPKLDVTGAYGVEGKGFTFAGANRQAEDGNFDNWELGVSLEVPLGNRAAKGEIRRARAQLDQAQIGLDDLQQRVVLEVRLAAREVQTALKRIVTAKTARTLSERQLAGEVERFKIGKSSNKVVLDYEEDLAQQQLRELRAVIAYRRALIALARSEGAVLESILGGSAPEIFRERYGPDESKPSGK